MIFKILIFLATITTVLNCETKLPKDLNNVGIEENIGFIIDKSTIVKTENNKTVTLGDLMKGSSTTMLNFVYFNCPMLCNLHLDGLITGLNKNKIYPGKKFKIITLSFDEKDKPSDALKYKNRYVSKLKQKIDPTKWNFVTTTKENIDTITSSVGFAFNDLENKTDFAHTSVIVVLKKSGQISRYLHGISFSKKNLDLALIESKERSTISPIEKGLLFCYNYDPDSRSYTLQAFKIVRVGSVIGLITLVIFIAYLIKKRKEKESNE